MSHVHRFRSGAILLSRLLTIVLLGSVFIPNLSAQKQTAQKNTAQKQTTSKSKSQKQAVPKTALQNQSSSPSTPQDRITTMLPDSLAQRFYDRQWKKVDSCLNRDLPKSALEIVETILADARKSKFSGHVVKALLYKAALQGETKDEGEPSFVRDVNTAIQESDKANDLVAVSLLRSALAEFYTQYLNRQRWKIRQRTATQDSSADFRAWDTRRFVETIRQLHFDALYFDAPTKSALLKQVSTEAVKMFLVNQDSKKDSNALRPLLYDLLAHRALAMLNNTANDLPKPEAEFELTDMSAFAGAKQFAQMQFSTPDANDGKYRTIRLYQELTALHLASSASPEALADVNLMRLQYAKEHTFAEGVEDKYLLALESFVKELNGHPAAAEYLFAIAQHWYEKADYIKSLEYCRAAQKFEKSRSVSFGSQSARALENSILHKELNVFVEKTVLPNIPFLVNVQFRNIDTAHFRLVRIENPRRFQRYTSNTDEEIARLTALKPVSSWSVSLPIKDSNASVDYKTHSVDIKPTLPIGTNNTTDLPVGFYALVASSRADFAAKNNGIAVTRFTVTRLSIAHENTDHRDRSDVRLMVNEAATGEPLSGVKVNLYRQSYNTRTNEYEETLAQTLTTDNNGFCSTTNKLMENGSLLAEAVREVGGQKDVLRDETWLSYNYPYQQAPQEKTIFFTDRALYRPGQTIFFKGIMLWHDDEKAENSVIASRNTTVQFYDVNGQKIAEQPLQTNAYGSFHGSFTAPKGTLNGAMTIRNENGAQTVRVEEYKRPKFEAKLEAPKGVFRVGENVKVSGSASAYAGSVVDGAEVRYRVVREARFPYWYWWWGTPPSANPKEIARGRVKTDAKGEFTLDFLAQPDKSLLPSTLPVFTFTVYADVTDISGETRSAETRVAVGYVATALNVSAPETLFTSQLASATSAGIRITTSNLNGEGIATQGTVTMEKLAEPMRTLRRRFLPKADRFILNESEFTSAFPHDEYKDESRRETWEPERELLTMKFASDAKGVVNLGVQDFTKALGALKPGVYRITADVQDVSGQKLKQIRHFTVLDTGGRAIATRTPFDAVPVKTSGEPGETAQLLLSTPYTNAKALFRVEHRGKIVQEEWLTLSSEQKMIAIPLSERHRGNVSVHLSMVHDYRFYTEAHTISVPWTNKQLRVETSVFRDKMLPGSKEEWRLTVRDTKGEKVMAEMLAGMYDASLDALVPHSWSGFSWQTFYAERGMSAQTFGTAQQYNRDFDWNRYVAGGEKRYNDLYFEVVSRAIYGTGGGYSGIMRKKARNGGGELNAMPQMMAMETEDAMVSRSAPPAPPPAATASVMREATMADADEEYSKAGKKVGSPKTKQEPEKPQAQDLSGVQARTNLSETAFFFPQMQTNDKGETVLTFTMPEALTRWKMLAFAHTPDLKTGMMTKEAVTQKELMVLPNMPRFVREGDNITLPVKISNLATKDLTGAAELKLFDASTMQELKLSLSQKPFTVVKARSTVISWTITVPEGLQTLLYRVVAKAGDSLSSFSDGEEAMLPVLPNRMLVTETLPLYVRGGQTKNFELKKLSESGKSSTLRHQKLTLEMTSNPAWYAIQALPMMMEYPYDCVEQTWNRFYANSIATHLANSKPRIKAIFEQWKQSPDALLSKLEKNEELKSLLLQETPWVMDGKDESERKRRVGLLFDLNRMSDELGSALKKLEERQTGNGGFSWFPGMEPSRFMTQYLVSGMGHLQKLGVTFPTQTTFASRLEAISARAVDFIDQEIATEYTRLKAQRGFKPENEYLSYDAVQYLYARSFFVKKPIPSYAEEAFTFWKKQAAKHWTNQGMMGQSMIALALHRFNEKDTPALIIKSFRERALHSDEMGMYWKIDGGWWWWQASIETQSLLIETFGEIPQDKQAAIDVEDMKVWLLKQKQTTDWKTTKATAEACYALLLRGTDWLESTKLVDVTLGGKPVEPKKMDDVSIEAGTGYYKVSWGRGEITPEMGKLTLKKDDAGIAWGGLYWQYFERLDKITPAKTPLAIDKKLYRQNTTAKGLELEPITAKTLLSVGDLVKVRVEIRTDRDMEYIHLRDMRGAGLEPVAVLSHYVWRDGLGYYETMKDASANFFIGWLPKGVHVFEYALRVSHEGQFQNGITTIQSMYAPEFSSHSEGVTVRVGK
ncbi:MAG: hypothetical protein JNN25_11520 [Candidatus Kapabacteria bacterium]|nr:hypothetical protein [Candidatus Kapabacteria bacterium]